MEKIIEKFSMRKNPVSPSTYCKYTRLLMPMMLRLSALLCRYIVPLTQDSSMKGPLIKNENYNIEL